ncbi:MAG: DNA primase small subunit domain-containing protein, partial [Candidatus Lokiarchaeota archaeon]
REFGFIPWNKQIMIRHMGFANKENFVKYLINNAPRHVYSSGSLYKNPDNQTMERKNYIGCDLIIDIDVDHFYTPCKEDHDFWKCKECGEMGTGMIEKCPKCGKLKLEKLSWICKDCLSVAKNEIFKLINDFLIPDFGIKEEEMHIAFSGHRGYHLKVQNEEIRTLSSEGRREIADYLTGNNISFELMGLQQSGPKIYGLIRENLGWSHKIILKIEEILKTYSDDHLLVLLDRFGLNNNVVNSFINQKDSFLNTLSDSKRNIWNIEGFGLANWKKFLSGIVEMVGAEIDEPVTIDIHRLIRYPESLHGKTGFKVSELSLQDLKTFNPLDESNKKIDPIIFESKKNFHKVKIIPSRVPQTNIKGETFGPYTQNEIIEIPNHIAVFLLSKGVATLV